MGLIAIMSPILVLTYIVGRAVFHAHMHDMGICPVINTIIWDNVIFNILPAISWVFRGVIVCMYMYWANSIHSEGIPSR
jgi:hypothetical protein